MKQYIKDNQIYDLPISIKQNGKVIITNNEKLILEHGYSIYEKV
jgi:hypothetical protein